MLFGGLVLDTACMGMDQSYSASSLLIQMVLRGLNTLFIR